jgi:uncharacterized protein (DUF4415 family)
MAKNNKRPRHVSPIDWDAVDSPALRDDILAASRPACETFPDLAEASAKRKRGERGPQKKPHKVLISLRVEAGTLEAFKAKGRGYQTPHGGSVEEGREAILKWSTCSYVSPSNFATAINSVRGQICIALPS